MNMNKCNAVFAAFFEAINFGVYLFPIVTMTAYACVHCLVSTIKGENKVNARIVEKICGNLPFTVG